MRVRIRCANPDCHKFLRVGDGLAGRRVKCPACGHAMPIPAAARAVRAPEPPRPVPPPRPATGPPTHLRRRWLAGAAATVLVLAGAGAAVLLNRGDPPPPDDGKAAPSGGSAGGPADPGAGPKYAPDLPRDGPGDPALDYDRVRGAPAAFRGKRVTWPAFPLAANGDRMLCGVNPEARDKDWRLFKVYNVGFASEKECGDAFHAFTFRDGTTVTATVAGEETASYDVSGPGGAGKERRTGKVPLLLHPSFRPAEQPPPVPDVAGKPPGAAAPAPAPTPRPPPAPAKPPPVAGAWKVRLLEASLANEYREGEQAVFRPTRAGERIAQVRVEFEATSAAPGALAERLAAAELTPAAREFLAGKGDAAKTYREMVARFGEKKYPEKEQELLAKPSRLFSSQRALLLLGEARERPFFTDLPRGYGVWIHPGGVTWGDDTRGLPDHALVRFVRQSGLTAALVQPNKKATLTLLYSVPAGTEKARLLFYDHAPIEVRFEKGK